MPASQPAADLIRVICPTCHARLHARPEHEGRRIVCPDCGVKIVVRRPKELPKQRLATPEEIGHYGVGAAHKPPPMEMSTYAATTSVYVRPESKPPRWTFFSGVFNFPWYPGTLRRWIVLSALLLVLGEFVAGLKHLMESGGGAIGGVAMAFFALPLVWLSLWSGSLAAACSFAIIQDTAAGNDEVVNWPESNWREWFWRLLHAGYLLSIALVVGYGIASVSRALNGPFWLPLAAVVYMLFPIIVLSSLEADSPWMPLSAAILTSMLTRAWAWGMFYLEASVLTAGVLAPLAFGFLLAPFLAPLVAAPAVSAIVLINARLLGRLAWRISVSPSHLTAS